MSSSSSSPQMQIISSILAYSFCSGTMLLLNKMTLSHFPYPSLVTLFQLVAALAIIATMKCLISLPVDPIRWKFVVPYSYYIIGFALGVYCNMKSLSQSNVETVIVFKALSPCVVSFLDAIFLGREYPSKRSWMALGIIVLGAFGYASHDAKFQSQGYMAYQWPFAYLITISFEMAYGKSLLKSVDLKTQSGPVVYTNLLGILPMMLFAAMGNEYQNFSHDHLSSAEETSPISTIAWVLLTLSCLAGTGIGYSSWWCRGMVSATSFTLIGVMNKCLTILLNILVWDQHAPPLGIASLFLCLVGGMLYRQAPLRRTMKSNEDARLMVSDDNASAFDAKVIALEEQQGQQEKDDNSSPLRNRSEVEDDLATPLMEDHVPDLEGSSKRR